MTKEIIHQDLEFLLSQQTDLIKILKFKREDTRKNINSLLKNKIPDIFEKFLTKDQQRLLRVSQFQPLSLNENEKKLVIRLKNFLNSLREAEGRCFNMAKEKEQILEEKKDKFQFNIPGFPMTFCVSVMESVKNKLVNSDLMLVDVLLIISFEYSDMIEEKYVYPLDDDDSSRFLGQIYENNINLDEYGAMWPADLLDITKKINKIRLELKK